jgi:hypothetical protein
MKIIYLNSEYDTGKHKILKAIYDRDYFLWVNKISRPHTILQIDEVAGNQKLCSELINMEDDEFGENRYYIDNDGDLCENIDWTPVEEEEEES